MTEFDKPRVLRGTPISLEAAIYSLLPETGSVEVQRDTPGRHPPHAHGTHEILLIVEGNITFHIADKDYVCTSGDRLYLPAHTLHASTAGEKSCIYIIAQR
ncbi:cupin domain-containing protein [Alicyclobacillus vulcanalis]|uniref:AraC-like ligand binding domain-containing protein n=1 Tax=Alicyclobacillus vulcanalis TaxID=252246 RepID=A0A1N7M658_9BACL|nr:AraC-like ligand binding domain-containing protein [Alicyclobacillus vulcanalis]